MKKIDNIIYLLFLMVMTNCSDNEIIKQYQDIEVTASLPSSRTTYASDNGITFVSWEERDAIGLSVIEQENLKYCAQYAGEETNFKADGNKLQADENDSVFAYYPFTTEYNNGKIKMPFTQGQQWDEKNKVPDFMIASSKVENGKVSFLFEHIFAYIKISVQTEKLTANNLLIISDKENFSILDGWYELGTGKITGDFSSGIFLHIEESIMQEKQLSKYIAILPQPESTVVEIKSGSTLLYKTSAPSGGFKAGNVYHINLNEDLYKNRKEKDIKALKVLYESTNGDNWKNNSNWFSEKPLSEWYGLYDYNYYPSDSSFDFFHEFWLDDNNLSGTLPPEFAYFMDYMSNNHSGITGNGLHGKIPEEIITHPRWNELGWSIIEQNPFWGGGFDFSEGSKLFANNAEVEYLDGKKVMLYDILKEHKISHIMIAPPNDIGYNRLLSYRNKGYEIIVVHNDWGGGSRDDKSELPIKEGITRLWMTMGWMDTKLNGLGRLGSTYMIDEHGELIDYYYRDWGVPESYYEEKYDSVLYARLGEPEDHPPFSTEYYTSTDYSRDGEVVVLQKAKEGKGIDLVFMGDAYVDKAMNDGGKYEEDMKASMEYFFEVEPYKSFRDRFNVYAVKVISPNEESVEGCEQRINYSDEICFEYAKKIPGIDMDKVTIVNVANHPNIWTISGFTNMYETGASVAHIEQGGPSSIIVHEAGGHGFAKLLDEYIYDGYEGNYCPPENLPAFKEWIDTDYHNRGWGVNIDTTNDPEKVVWSHFLNDERYTNEVGIYQGAWFWPTDLWRPSENSVMNNDYSRFNAPSREAIYKRIMELSEGEDWTYNYEDFVTYDAINRNAESRSVSTSSQSRQKVHKDHRPPTFIKGSWRDAAKGKSEVVVPFR